jgi:Trk K+ transport system NAD-binding subunit
MSLMRTAGANRVIPLYKIIGRYLAIRSTTCGAMAHVLDSFGDLQIAEIPVYGTPFAGKSLAQAQIGQLTGLAVIGIWERGVFASPTPDIILNENALLVLSGTHGQLEKLEELTGESPMDDLVFILGHGRIGCAAASFLERKPVPFILVDKMENKSCREHIPLYGDATVRNVLMEAGIERAKGLIATTNDDNINVFLTLAIRERLPHIRLVARANHEDNVEQLYLAGADFVVSNASVGASILMNILESKASVFLTEGIHVFRRPVPTTLLGLKIGESKLRLQTGCSVVALEKQDGIMQVSPTPETVLHEKVTLILIGSPDQEELFDKTFRKP